MTGREVIPRRPQRTVTARDAWELNSERHKKLEGIDTTSLMNGGRGKD